MSVYEARYRKISEDSVRVNPVDASWSMALFEIRRGLSGTWPKVVLVFGGFILFGFLVSLGSILLNPQEEFWLGEYDLPEGVEQRPPNMIDNISLLLTPIRGPGAIMIIQIAVISAGLISGDLRDRAIDLYFSKIRMQEYLASKIIASMALTFIGMPLFAVIYVVIAMYKRWPFTADSIDEIPLIGEVFWKTFLLVAVTVLFLSVLILVFSAYTTNPVNSGVLFLVFSLVSQVIFEGILFTATDIDLFYALSPLNALDTVRREIMRPDAISEQFFELSVVSMIGYFILSLALVYFKLRREQRR